LRLGVDFGFVVSGRGFELEVLGARLRVGVLGFGVWVRGLELSIQCSVFSVLFSVFCFQRSVLSVWGLGLSVQGAGFRTDVLEFQVQGLGSGFGMDFLWVSYLTEICSGSETGSYSRLIDFVSLNSMRVMKINKRVGFTRASHALRESQGESA